VSIDIDRVAEDGRAGRAALHREVDGLSTQLAVLTPRVDRLDVVTGRLEGVVGDLGRADVRVETQLTALTSAVEKGQVQSERRQEEVLGLLRARHEAEDRASEARWAILRESRTQALIALVVLAVLAPQALPAIVELVRGWFGPG